ncbi:MAG: hypothetical protein ACJ0BK_00700 [Coraliomargaritaceae bacterium]
MEILKNKHASVRIGPSNPDHHLYSNNGVWWLHYTSYPTPATSKRIRRSLRTRDVALARSRRDGFLRQSSLTRREWRCHGMSAAEFYFHPIEQIFLGWELEIHTECIYRLEGYIHETYRNKGQEAEKIWTFHLKDGRPSGLISNSSADDLRDIIRKERQK